MFAFRRAAARAVASPSLFTLAPARSQALRTYTTVFAKGRQPSLTSSVSWQRRFASDDASTPAETRGEPEATDAPEHTSGSIPAREAGQEAGAETGSSTVGDAVATGAERAAHAVSDVGGPKVVEDALHNVAASSTTQSRAPRGNGRQLFIGNLAFSTDEAALRELFGEFGRVTDVKLMLDDQGRSRGFGWVTFSTAEEMHQAIEATNTQQLDGRTIYTQVSQRKSGSPNRGTRAAPRASDLNPRRNNPPSPTLWIGNMPYDMTDTDLNNLFRPLKNVTDVRIAVDQRTGQARGFAHADFLDEASATEAMEALSQKTIAGRRLRLDYSTNFGEKRQRRSDANAEYNEEPRTEQY